LDVSVRLFGAEAKAVRSLGMTPDWAGTAGAEVLERPLVRDGSGRIELHRSEQAGRFALGRSVQGSALCLSYFARAGSSSRYGLRVERGFVSSVGHGFLLLPEIDGQIRVRLRWELDWLGQPTRSTGATVTAASSIGVGTDVIAHLAPADLAHSIYLAGPVLVREGGFGERLVVLGRPSFDPDRVLGFASDVLHAGRQIFEVAEREPLTFAIAVEPGRGEDHHGAALYRSFALWLDQGRLLDGRLKILIAHELIHRWIGRRLRLVGADGEDAAWFSEGFTRYYARTLLLRHQWIEPADLLADLERDLAWRERAFAPESAAGEARWGKKADAHLGALYATRLGAQLGRAGKLGLDQLLARRMRRAPGGAPPPFSEADWREEITTALGPAAAEELDRLVLHRQAPIDLPAGALGPCLERVERRVVRYELGFDPRSVAVAPAMIQGLVPGSAAERAGLQEGDLVLEGAESAHRGDPDGLVRLLVAGRGGHRVVRYRPRAEHRQVAWQPSRAPGCRIATAR